MSFISSGKIIGVHGSALEVLLPLGGLNDECQIETRNGDKILAEIVSFRGNKIFISPFDEISSITLGDPVICYPRQIRIKIPKDPLGLIIEASGKPLQSEVEVDSELLSINPLPTNVLSKKPIDTQLETGIKIIDSMIPIGFGQRLGLFASAGLGKSTLLASIAKKYSSRYLRNCFNRRTWSRSFRVCF